jgi:hypothetical protein
MSLLPIYYSTNSTKKRKNSKSRKQLEADKAHEAFVLRMTNGKKADKKVLDFNWRSAYNETMKVSHDDYVSAGMSGSASSCTKRGVMANLHKESEKTKKEILDKASRVMPLYNKGGLQYATPKTDLTEVGTKSRRN